MFATSRVLKVSAKRTKLFRALPEKPEKSWLRSIAKIVKKPIYGFSLVLIIKTAIIVWFLHTRHLVKFSCVCGIKDPFWAKDVRCLTGKESRHRLTDVRNCRQCSILNEITNQNVDGRFDSENAWFNFIHSAYVHVHKKHATFLYIDFTRE